jgi:hypothetical protein
VGLAALVVAAIVSFVQDGPAGAPPSLPTPTEATPTVVTDRLDSDVSGELPRILPLPAELRDEGGVMWWSSTGCDAGGLTLSSGAVTRIRGEHCRIWPSPTGAAALTVTARRSAALEGRGLSYVTLDGNRRVVFHTQGFIGSEVAWSADGAQAALCVGTRDGTVVDVYRSVPGERDSIPGPCAPAWLGDGRLAVSRAGPVSIEIDGRAILGPDEARELLPSVGRRERRAISALAASGERLVVGLVAASDVRLLPSSAAVAVLRSDGQIEFAAHLQEDVLPAAVGLAPDASALWYYDAGQGNAVIVSIPGGARAAIFDASRWVAWSPDGSYLAAATEEGIVVRRWPEGQELARIPVEAADVSWTPTP